MAYMIAQDALVSKFIPALPDVDDKESDKEDGSETEGSESGGSEEDVDEDIEADEPPSKTSKLTNPTSEDPASKVGARKLLIQKS
jgi:hypothetical protein